MFPKILKTYGFLEKGAFAAVRTLNFGQIRSGGIGDFAFKSSNVRSIKKRELKIVANGLDALYRRRTPNSDQNDCPV
jgi:hypothetical protein